MNDHPFALQILPVAPGHAANVVTSSTGSKLSSFMLLDVGPGQGFYLYNPVSRKLLAQDTQNVQTSDVGTVAEDFTTFMASRRRDRYIWHLFLDDNSPIARESSYSQALLSRIVLIGHRVI